MNKTIKGAKAGAQQPRQPVIDLDSAQSKTFIKILYGLSEGPIKGLANGYKSIFLDDTPLQDFNGNWNFENVSVDIREGTNDQTYIEGFPDISSETAIGVELKSETPWVKAFNNTELDAVRLRLRWGPLRQQNESNGDLNGYTIRYAVDVQTDGGTWSEVLNTQISDKTSANYERSHRIDLPKADSGWQVRIRRLTPNTSSEFISDKMYVQAVTEVIDAKLRYPNTALLGLRYDAQTFSNVVKMAVECEGVEILLPSNYNPETRVYTGLWDGSFKRAYSNNPAWHFYDACITKRYALGNRINSSMIDKWSIYRLGQYCDQLVPDGKGGQEPRFTLNVYEQSQDDAWSVLSKMAGAFRAYIYWDGQAIVCDADIPQDTLYTFTSANVIDGRFEYSGTRARDRHTIAKVAYDNPENRYKTEYEIVRDEAAIAKYGIRILDISAYGCTSVGQAQRAGNWALKTEQFETRTVTFKVGLDGFIPRPGKVIEIADPIFAGRANGGRISSVSTDLKSITVDRDDVVCRAGDRLVVNGEDGKAQARIVQSKSGRVITVVAAFDSIAAQNVWIVDAQDLATMKFRVVSISRDDTHQFTITGLQYNPAKFDAIDQGTFIDDRPISIINPNLQSPVESVSVSSDEMVQQGLTIATMLISWPQATSAVKYLVEWRKDDGSWIKMPITGNNSVEVQGIYSGNYQAKVTAINAFEVASLPTYSILTELKGKQGTPPALAFINATGILFGIKLEWGFPSVGALDTAYTEIQVSPDGVSNIAQLGLFAYPTSTHTLQGLQPNLKQYYRARLIDRIGNIGPWSSWTNATTSADASDILEILEGKITESQLHQDLQTKIDQIGGVIGDVDDVKQQIQETKEQIAQEVQDRKSAIQSAEDGLTQKITDGDNSVLEVVNTVKESSENGLAAVQDQVKVVADNLKLTAEKTDGVYAQLNPPLIGSESDLIGNNQGFAGSWSLQSAMIEGDLVVSKRVDTTVAELNNLQAYTQQEVQARIEGDKVTVQKIDNYIASNDGALAAVRETASAAATQSSANAERIEGIYAQVNPPLIGSESDLIGNSGGYAGVWSEQSARIEGDLAQAIRTDTVQTELNGNKAAVQEVTQSVNGLYAQKFIKLDVNGKIAGWGGANNGVESQFILNFDSFAIGSGNSTGYYPFIFRTTPFTDPVTGTVFPVSAYLKAAMMDYQSVNTSHIVDLSVKTAKIDSLAVTTAKIDNLAVTEGKIANLAVDTLKIKDNAVTVPVSAFAEANLTIGTSYTTVQTLAVPADMGHTILTFGSVFSFVGYTSSQRLLCRVLKNGSVVFEDLEVHFIDYASVGTTTQNSGQHNHGITINVSGSMTDSGSHSHSFNGNTQNSTAGTISGSSHNHSYNGSTNTTGSHSHNLSLSGSASMGLDGIHNHNVEIRGSARSAGTLNISRHDSTLIAGTFELQLRSDSGGNVNVSQRYIHAMTMRK
ncbi:host specificity protein J [Acinetobacter guillouiae]|uniref:host specificity protein J n=1 Tax=Acinetobacter guillouiae TaxID=106649 RepID=UPI001250A7EE|nr:phage tail protein [Acinetobacter guillouiae]